MYPKELVCAWARAARNASKLCVEFQRRQTFVYPCMPKLTMLTGWHVMCMYSVSTCLRSWRARKPYKRGLKWMLLTSDLRTCVYFRYMAYRIGNKVIHGSDVSTPPRDSFLHICIVSSPRTFPMPTDILAIGTRCADRRLHIH